MYRLIFSIVFPFSWTLCEIVVIRKQNDKIYTGHMLFELSMPMWSLCAQYCSRVQLCKSINFITSNKTCQINDAEPGESNGGELIESTGNSFVAASIFPEELAGPCKGHGCKPTEVCIPKSPTYSCITVQFSKNRHQIRLWEVAYGKSCQQSSTAGVEYASKAVDGDLNTYMHTNKDQSPYWIVDLGKPYQIKLIEIFNRNKGSIDTGRRLHDLDIIVGTSSNNMHLCTHYAGPAQLGDHLVFGCQYDEKARYVKLMIRGREFLHVAEVKVYALYE
ncbi:uncharacterized protein LOC127705171 [Mytilus californianus]|uniref:uncharacterized protein LOC127705171 n=1 Tax=Mytilus californianus TaxID=6549 RepID=UPI0022456556|nr:uncharacterized protein LOC127705171 [Mytilus californianus]